MTINRLYKIITDRIRISPADSYVSDLVRSGQNRVAQKIGEEATEVVIASLAQNKQALILEMADLWFHSLILLATKNINPKLILDELDCRHQNKA